jgi:hypothetical protein
MSLTLQSTRKLNDGNEIPALGFGVYQSEPGDETEQAVLWALEVSAKGVKIGYRINNGSKMTCFQRLDTATLIQLLVGLFRIGLGNLARDTR